MLRNRTRSARTSQSSSRVPRTPRSNRITRRSVPRTQRASTSSSIDWSRLRIWCVGIVFASLWCVLWGRAYYIQIIKGPELTIMASRQHSTPEVITGARGNITDRNGYILAQTIDAPSIAVNSLEVRNPHDTAKALAALLHMPTDKVYKAITSGKKFSWVARKVDYKIAQQVEKAKILGISLVPDSKRVYPYSTLAGHLLGFVGTDDKGLDGLEKSLDSMLHGEQVKTIVQRDASGRKLELTTPESDYASLRGKDVILTLDANIQFFAEESLMENVEHFGAKWGGCLVIDVPTGDILAWAQFPSFDPNNFNAYKQEDRRNRIAMDALEQGSTIKSFLVAAALENGLVEPQTPINCENGSWRIGRATIHDTRSYKILPVQRILHVSSNIGAAKIGQMLGAEKYYDYLIRLGFGEKTSLPLAGEAKGILRQPNSWQEIDLASTSFGQSFSATLLQMGQAYHVLANNGVKKDLRLVRNIDQAYTVPSYNEGEQIFSKTTIKQIHNMLRDVVEEDGGTGRHARIPGLVAGGKTGTAQKADSSGRYGRGRVGSFVGMLPIEDPRFLVLVLLDEPQKVSAYGGVIATPVFRHVALHTMSYHGLLPETEELAKEMAVANKPQQQSISFAQNVPATPQQTPSHTGATLSLSDAYVPKVLGYNVHRAVETFAAQGTVPAVTGNGPYVVRQSPAGGSLWGNDRKCTIWLGEEI